LTGARSALTDDGERDTDVAIRRPIDRGNRPVHAAAHTMHHGRAMRSHIAVLGLFAGALSCGGGALSGGGTGGVTTGVAGTSATGGSGGTAAGGTGGTAAGGTGGTAAGGTGGTSGVAGTSAAGGSGGTGGFGATIGGRGGVGLPACGGSTGIPPSSPDFMGIVIAGLDGMAFLGTVTATVTVGAVESCTTVSCPGSVSTADGGFAPLISTALRIGLNSASPPQTWTLYLAYRVMPADLIKVGDTFEMTLRGAVVGTWRQVDQMVVLARGSDLVMFAFDGHANVNQPPPLPQLDAFGIAVTDEDQTCESPRGFGCRWRSHILSATVGTASAILTPGTTRIGWLSLTDGAFTHLLDTGNCDSWSETLMAGFRTPLGGGGGSGGSGGSAAGSGGTGAGGIAGAGGSGAGGGP
jgi:hypothetical protein